ncbi:hybrid non-ribosomal peptide synthetase/type I polyketide synthase [Pseudoalteromonas sp. R3]|uniref:hybrid non-ribosomal peptide synthetase/type I polyketide synthase n=1 Tax=Pseudoalteromonas sp. R3 TaxID=1709477 RepID=UPI0006B62850|nr:hybrid non-ribosomal peptide synthetase/type I polyketide synthase [Pseudoalteromonas sp. R3]AZZ95796.1 hybrid non-ribosomal peptide synthetase/type I polyketide synthase [Pseudoalteromonas sp. R3]
MNNDLVATLVTLARTRGDDIAYQYFFEDNQPAVSLSYAELDLNSRRIAARLLTYFEKGDRALLLYNSGFEFVEAFFACLYAGIVAVPAYPPKKNQNTDRLRSIIEDAGATGALTSSKIYEIAQPLFEAEASLGNVSIIATDGEGAELVEPMSWQDIQIAPQDLAFLQYTSGSTGSPKGVMVSHGNIMDNEEMMKLAFGHSAQTPIVSWLPHFHDMGLIFGILHPIYIGAPAALMNPTSFLQKPLRWLKLLSETKAVTSSAPNFAYDLCVDTIKEDELANLDLSHWQSALNGAEPVRASTLERFYQKFKRCGFRREATAPCYGMAETTLFATGGRLLTTPAVLTLDSKDMHQGKASLLNTRSASRATFYDLDDSETTQTDNQPYYAVSCGGTWHGHTLAIVDPNTKLRCEDGHTGEIWVKGASVAQGYWRKDELTEEIFKARIADDNDGPYLRTGDLGFVYQDELYVTGRAKDVMIFRGKNYYPQDIELTVVEAHSAMDNNGGAAFSCLSEQGEERLVIVQQVKRTAVRKLNEQEIFAAITAAVTEQHGITPYEVVLIKPGRILKTSSGKIQRQENKRHYLADTFDVLARSRAPLAQPKKAQDNSKVTDYSGVEAVLRKVLQEVVGLEVDRQPGSLDIDATFLSLGVDSMKAVRISGELMELHDIELEATVLYEYPSIAQLAHHLSQFESIRERLSRDSHITSEHNATHSESSKSSSQGDALTDESEGDTDVAVIGMACRYPQAADLKGYWQLLTEKRDAISVPDAVRQALCPALSKTRLGGYLNDIEQFDAGLFGISPAEARYIDPQHRLLLETSYHAIQSAGMMPAELAGQPVGVYVGISQNDYFNMSNQAQQGNPYLGTGTALSIAANRLSYTYNFTGPSLSVDTACSSSLVALHHALNGIRVGDMPMALVCGVNLILSNEVTDACDNAQMLAEDGRCKTFSRAADGYVRSEGVGCVLLKPLAQAMADKDPIYGVLKGSAVNQDGRSNGITAPNGASQQRVINSALQRAAVAPADIQYIETHGTGTELGDPIEVSALAKVYGEGRAPNQPLLLGSAKANIGHLESGAGLAGLIKMLLCLEKAQLPAQLHTEQLNAHIPWQKLPVEVATRSQAWPSQENKPRLAAVSSFGFGGTNAHVICAQRPENVAKADNDASQYAGYVLPLSAKSANSLTQLARRYADVLSAATPNVFDTLVSQTARMPHYKEVRHAFVGESREALVAALTAVQDLPEQANQTSASARELVFLFTGQGAQYPDMGKSLYDTQPEFRDAIDECDRLLADTLGPRLITVLYQDPNEEYLAQTQWTQVCLFAVEYAQAKLWHSTGLQPDQLVSHSVGEYAAACIAGIFSLADAIKLISARGRLMNALADNGRMVTARCDREQADALVAGIDGQISVSAYHGESGVVFSGHNTAMDILCKALQEQNVRHKEINTARAFHSPLMRPMLSEFAQVAAQVKYSQPAIAFVSSVTGKQEALRVCDPSYWVEQICAPVQFAACIAHLSQSEAYIALELGPKPVLCGLLQENRPAQQCEFLHVLHNKGADLPRLLAVQGRLFELGIELDWTHHHGDDTQPRVPLPLYPFDRSPYWILDIPSQLNAAQNTDFEESDEGAVGASRDDAIRAFVLNTLSRLLAMPVSDIQTHIPLLEMGVDSLMIMNAVRTYEREFGLEFSVRQFYEELSTVELLVAYIIEHSDYQCEATAPVAVTTELPQPNRDVASPAAVEQGALNVSSELVANICREQLQAAASVSNTTAAQSVEAVAARQLAMLQGQQNNFAISNPTTRLATQSTEQTIKTHAPATSQSAQSGSGARILPGFGQKQITSAASSRSVQRHLASLTDSYCAKTPLSKNLVSEHRAHLADCRASAGFRLSSKELLYPVFGKRCEGSRIWDIDGNEYIDITMDFGVNLFGHKPAFVTQALAQQIDEGLQLGLASPHACEVAELISELTGLERVTFCNSGTEAVMTAVRLARNKTRRNKIVQFEGAYHGHYDGTLAQNVPGGDSVEPMCGGVRTGAISDNLVLEYGADAALDAIRSQANDIAAVLVEPVQSRHPAHQPWAFLQALRALTTELGIALIFDEMITGFRAHPGGVQAMLGIEADMATYGKIVGGGLPIGVVAGSHEYLDGIDGGHWQYGDASYPQADTTFFAGTFCKHPLVMASAKAVLSEIKQHGAQLQEAISRKTDFLANTLNTFFTAQNIPIQIEHFTSLFRFRFSQNLDVFFYEMLNRGVFIWEGRNCFLSAAHTDADVNTIIQTVKDSALALKAAGYFGEPDPADTLPVQFPLTGAQQQLLALALKSEQGAQAYHVQAVLRLSGQLDKARLVQAVAQLQIDYSLLSYSVDPDTLSHVQLEASAVSLTEHTSTEQSLQARLADVRYRTFEFGSKPLCRFDLLQDGPQAHVLSITAHHVLYDGLSLQQMMSRIADNYTCIGGDLTAPATVHFSAYVEGVAKYLSSTRYQQDKGHWLDRLAQCEALALPTRPGAGRQESFTVEKQILELGELPNIAALSKAQGCGQFATLLAIYALWLHKLTGQQYIAVGIPVSDRQLLSDVYDPDCLDQHLPGYCTNILPVVADFSGPLTVAALVKQLQNSLLEAFEHQHLPYSELTHEAVSLPETLFNLDKVQKLPEFDGLTVSSCPTDTRFGQYELSCNLLCINGQWTLELEYLSARYDSDMMAQYAQSLVRLFAGLQAKQDCDKVSLLDSQMHAQLVTPISETIGQPLLLEALSARATQLPQNTALICAEQALCYEQLQERVNQLANYLSARGVGADSLVAIALPRRTELLVALLAVLKTGAAFLPLDLAFPQARLKEMLSDSQASCLLCDAMSEAALAIAHTDIDIVDLDVRQAEIAQCASDFDAQVITPQQRAYVIYTSGSTGKPKGVEISHGALANLLHTIVRQPGLEQSDCLLSVTTIAFDIALLELFGPLMVGGTVLLASEQACSDPNALADLIEQHPVTVMQATPTLWQLLLSTCPNFAAGLTVWSGGEPLSSVLAAQLLSQAKALWNMYGPTETTIWSATGQIFHPEDITIGQPVANTSLYVLPENATYSAAVQPVGVWGELWIGGAGLANGYLARPELTQARFVVHQFDEHHTERLYRTGDRARRLADGRFELDGRLDHQVKLHGHRIELGEIEAQLRNVLGDVDVRVFIKTTDQNQAALCAYCIEQGELAQHWTISTLRSALANQLPAYMLPEYLCWLGEWPTTANGKLDRNALVVPDNNHQAQTELCQPANPVEAKILTIYHELLNSEQLGTHHNFFECGGNSVLAMQLISRLNQHFAIRATVGDIFDNPSVVQLAVRVEDLNSSGAPAAPDGVARLSNIVSGRDISVAFDDQSMTEMDL